MKSVLAALAAWALALVLLQPARADESASQFFLQDQARHSAPQLHETVWNAGRVFARGFKHRTIDRVTGSIADMVTAAAHRHGVPVNVAHAIVKKESGYRCGILGQPTKYGRAIGIMQTIPSTARAMLGHLPRNCSEELEAGMKYLGKIVAKHGTSCAALARYEGNKFCSPYGRDAIRLARL